MYCPTPTPRPPPQHGRLPGVDLPRRANSPANRLDPHIARPTNRELWGMASTGI
jgi:hypothetical protein